MSRTSRRIVVFVTDDTDAHEALMNAIDYGPTGHEPWQPLKPGQNPRTTQQDRWPRTTTDEWIMENLHKHAGRIHLASTSIIPDEPTS